jgi:hypothetical protein
MIVIKTRDRYFDRFASMCKAFTYLSTQQKLFNAIINAQQSQWNRKALIMGYMTPKSMNTQVSEDFA